MPSKTHITVRFGETDAMGHVNNVSYYIYFEQARVDFLKLIGYPLGSRENRINIVVVRTSCDYITPAFFDQELIVNTYVIKIGTKSFTLQHDIVDAKSGTVIARGNSVAVIINEEQTQALSIPEHLKEALEGEFAKQDELL